MSIACRTARGRGAVRFAPLALALSIAAAGCAETNMEELGRQAAERAKSSIRAIDADALDQKLPPETIRKVQEDLTAIREYMGPVDGKLDQVLLNAFEAFQRSEGMPPNGIFDEKTLPRLAAAAAKAPRSGS